MISHIFDLGNEEWKILRSNIILGTINLTPDDFIFSL